MRFDYLFVVFRPYSDGFLHLCALIPDRYSRWCRSAWSHPACTSFRTLINAVGLCPMKPRIFACHFGRFLSNAGTTVTCFSSGSGFFSIRLLSLDSWLSSVGVLDWVLGSYAWAIASLPVRPSSRSGGLPCWSCPCLMQFFSKFHVGHHGWLRLTPSGWTNSHPLRLILWFLILFAYSSEPIWYLSSKCLQVVRYNHIFLQVYYNILSFLSSPSTVPLLATSASAMTSTVIIIKCRFYSNEIGFAHLFLEGVSYCFSSRLSFHLKIIKACAIDLFEPQSSCFWFQAPPSKSSYDSTRHLSHFSANWPRSDGCLECASSFNSAHRATQLFGQSFFIFAWLLPAFTDVSSVVPLWEDDFNW